MPDSDEYPVAPSVEAMNRALAPTVAGWMPVFGESREERRGFSGPAFGAGAASAPNPDALGAVGLHEGALVDRTYRVERALGVGGMGAVALATDERLDRKVAIKFIKPELFAFPEMRTFFHNEARAMARVGHRNVLSVFAFGEHEGTPYFVMEYVDGQTVEQWLRSAPAGHASPTSTRPCESSSRRASAWRRSTRRARCIATSSRRTCSSITSFRVAVGDLGVARVLDSATGGNFVVGSASYMAPEAALGEDEAPELASRRDIYALGCIAYELLTGRPPFTGQTDMSVLSQHVLRGARACRASEGTGCRLATTTSSSRRSRRTRGSGTRRSRPSAVRSIAEHSGAREPERILVADDDDDWRTIIVSSLKERFPDAVIDEVGDGERGARGVREASVLGRARRPRDARRWTARS